MSKSAIELMVEFCEKYPTLTGVSYLNMARALREEEKKEKSNCALCDAKIGCTFPNIGAHK